MNDLPPFIIGVTGKIAFPGYDQTEPVAPAVAQLRERVRAILDWLRYEAPEGKPTGRLDPLTGRFDREGSCGPQGADASACWRPHGLTSTPIVVLSSLAPGVDTIVAEAVLDYAEEHSDARVTVRGVMPFRRDVYERASTFYDENDPESSKARQARFWLLIERIEGQRNGQVGHEIGMSRDVFSVELDEDLEFGHDQEADLVDDDEDTGKPRRYLRYRAAGEYIATYSHLLLAVYDPNEEPDVDLTDPYECGTQAIVHSRRNGATYELLAMPNAFAWADNGPILHVPIETGGNQLGPLRLLQPEDTRPVAKRPSRWLPRTWRELIQVTPRPLAPAEQDDELRDDDPEWHRDADNLFRRVVQLQESLNRRLVNTKAETRPLLRPGRS